MRGVCVRVCVSVHKHSAFCLIVTYIGQNLGRVFKIIGQGRSRTRSFFSDGSRSLSKIMTCFIVGGEIPSPRALFPSVLFCLFVCLSAGWDKKLWINVLIFWWRSGHSAIKWAFGDQMVDWFHNDSNTDRRMVSVCPARSCIASTLSSTFFTIQIFRTKSYFANCNILTGRHSGEVWKNCDFPSISRFMSEMIQDMRH